MIKDEDDPRYVSLDRVKKLAFLFRREIANHLRRDGDERLLAATISCALRGDDETNTSSRSCIDMLISLFHPDKQQRQDAAQRLLDNLEFGFESEIKKAEFKGDPRITKLLRQQMQRARVDAEKRHG